MIVYQFKIKSERGSAFYTLDLDSFKKSTFKNILIRDEFSESLKSKIKQRFPNLKNKEKVHTEIQLVWDDNISVPSNSVLVIYSYYIPCAGNRCSFVSCAEELVKYAKKINLKIIIGYHKFHRNTDNYKSLEILKNGNIEVFHLADLN